MIDFEALKGKQIRVKQVKSIISSTPIQRANIKGLGLRGIRTTSDLKCTDAIIGMIKKVAHLVTVEIL